MTNKPDRQDGDGLSLREHCVRWLRRKRVTAELSTADLKIKAKEFERHIGADAEQMLSDAAQPGEIDGYPHSAIAGAVPSPTRDGAEGAAKCSHGNPLYVWCPYCQPAAPPKPAPDAVRERDKERPIIVHCIGVLIEKFGANPLDAAWAIFDYLGQPKSLAALSAPVPSPDGAGEPFKTCPGCEMRRTCADMKHCYGPSYVELKERFVLSPSPAVPAEPVAWENMDIPLGPAARITNHEGVAKIWREAGANVRPLYASPTVRGDREAIKPAIENLTNNQKQCDMDGIYVMVSRQALTEVLEFLSLSLQPCAGERE